MMPFLFLLQAKSHCHSTSTRNCLLCLYAPSAKTFVTLPSLFDCSTSETRFGIMRLVICNGNTCDLFWFYIYCHMNLQESSSLLPFLSHPLTTVCNLDSCRINCNNNITSQFRLILTSILLTFPDCRIGGSFAFDCRCGLSDLQFACMGDVSKDGNIQGLP